MYDSIENSISCSSRKMKFVANTTCARSGESCSLRGAMVGFGIVVGIVLSNGSQGLLSGGLGSLTGCRFDCICHGPVIGCNEVGVPSFVFGQPAGITGPPVNQAGVRIFGRHPTRKYD